MFFRQWSLRLSGSGGSDNVAKASRNRSKLGASQHEICPIDLPIAAEAMDEDSRRTL